MTTRVIQTGGAALSLLAATTTGFADIKVNENFAVGGYAAGSYRYYNESKTDKFDLDATKVAFTGDFKPVTGVVSLYHVPTGAADDLNLLDAYVTYDLEDGLSVTGGKFLSWLGFEAFDIPNMYQISYANGDFLGAIPGYHSGVRLNYTSDQWIAGAAVLDSVYSLAGRFEGDGELRGNAGYEAFVSYVGIKGLTLWAGAAYQTAGETLGDYAPQSSLPFGTAASQPIDGSQEEVFTVNFWASYQINDDLLAAVEYVKKEGYFVDGYNWLAFLNWAYDEKTSTTFRVSGEDIDNGPSFMKYTIAPTFKLSDNFSLRVEVSQYSYDDFVSDDDTFAGVQGVFKF